jgi:3D (Asp-Asp-Asp) domain-containing protein
MKRKRKTVIILAANFSILLLAAGLVTDALRANSDLEEQRKLIHDKYQELQKQQKELQQTLMQQQQQIEQLQQQNRALQQENDQLEDQLEQAKQKQWLSFKATYYDLGYESCGKYPGDPGYGITASGRRVEHGVTLSVDPKLIPLGSWVEVMYPDGRVEKRRADDTGSAIKGRRVDVYVADAAGYGVDTVKIRILSTPNS